MKREDWTWQASAFWWLALFILSQWLFAEIKTQELVAGALFAVTGTIAVRWAGPEFRITGRPKVGWLCSILGKAVVQCVPDCVQLCRALGKSLHGQRIAGRFEELPLDPQVAGPGQEVNRAILTAAASAPPNSYVVSVDARARILFLHRLLGTAGQSVPGSRKERT